MSARGDKTITLIDIGGAGVTSSKQFSIGATGNRVSKTDGDGGSVRCGYETGPGMNNGRHLQCTNGTPISNALLSIARHLGVGMNRFSNSTGAISELFS